MGNQSDMVASIQLTFPLPGKYYLNITRELEKIVFRHINTMFTARHIVSAAFSPGQRLLQAMCWCRGLCQAWRLSAAKGIAVALRRESRK